MRVFAWILLVLVSVPLVLFAASNSDQVVLELFPLPFELNAPLWMVTLSALAIGFLVGAVFDWTLHRRHRRLARQSSRKAEALERDVTALRAQLADSELRLDTVRNAPAVVGDSSKLLKGVE